VTALLSAPCPPAIGSDVADRRPTEKKLAAARAGRFSIYNGVTLGLHPPVDWGADPIHALRFIDTFQKLRFLNPLLWAYHSRGDVPALRQALALVVDWVRQNPLGGAGTATDAWVDKVAGDRVPLIAYTARAAACEHLLDRPTAQLLLASMRQHGAFLAQKATEDLTNHGLFTDIGLALVVRYFPFLSEARDWQALARAQFLKTLRGRLANGVWLEHSTAYQFLAIRAVQRFAAYTGDPTAKAILRRMKRAAAWLVEPDDQMTQFGDSYLFPVPAWGLRIAHRLEGLQVFPQAGFAVVRAPAASGGGDGYLAVASDFHNTTHKHADDLSFELYDHGHRIVSDTGLYAKDPGPIRDFVLSARAHSVLTVDNQGFPILDPSKAYGSGLIAAGQGDGWYAIEGRNPLVRDQGVDHRRLFLYRPGVALIVCDRVRSGSQHLYTRHFQLGPQVRIANAGPSATALHAAGLDGRLYDAPAPRPAAREEVRGSHDPIAGWTSPHFRQLVPRWTVSYSSRAADDDFTATFAFHPSALRADTRSFGLNRTVVSLNGASGPRLVVTRSGAQLHVRASP
jgi:hypothetical protein